MFPGYPSTKIVKMNLICLKKWPPGGSNLGNFKKSYRVINCMKYCQIINLQFEPRYEISNNVRVPTRQGKVREICFFFKVREFCKMVREIRKSSKVRENSGNFKIMLG